MQVHVVLIRVVFICRFNNMKSIPWGTVKYGLYKQVVFIHRWSLEQVWLKKYLIYTVVYMLLGSTIPPLAAFMA